MILLMYFILMTACTTLMYLSTTPILLGINILILALLLSATLATSLSAWYAFMVYLIYIGGMLVMFAYFLALTPNQQMPTKSSITYLLMTMATLVAAMIATNTKVSTPNSMYQDSMYLYSMGTVPTLVLLALILLLTMVIVVKLTNRSKGPLRPFN
uniref:NADH dehydrogenase subunit 6 n=1 Tax=Metaphire riukiuensis TaxID=585718 RepID=A0AA48GEP4_9ANNE|nr:NADH dehydrogenase subunit 6 [Metaphire riukiuensis]